MKRRIGLATGFITGLAGFLIGFRFLFLDHIPPEDELAPGIVVFVSVLSGLLFALAGHLIQGYLRRGIGRG